MKHKMQKITALLLIVVVMSPMMIAFARPVCPMERTMAQIYTQAVANVTNEQLAEIAAHRQAEEDFLANLSPETMWIEWLKDNCVQDLTRAEVRYVREKIDKLYIQMSAQPDAMDVMGEATNSTPLARNIEVWTRRFSEIDGLTNRVVIAAIESYGVMRGADAQMNFPNDRWRRDAFRHYAWNFFAAGSIAVGVSVTGRMNSTRIYTTNREMVTMVFRHLPHLDVANPTDLQIATGIQFRTIVLTKRHFDLWTPHFNCSLGREDLMDLWNNEMGRQDATLPNAAALSQFNIRWNNRSIIRSNSTADVTLAIRQQIFNNRWDIPTRR
ncbi:MAG: hypothetical protein FWB93_01630 [Oscillospiraceae bacterium]|nr:hypothetical protein [Oscillospiraceae bacterium]